LGTGVSSGDPIGPPLPRPPPTPKPTVATAEVEGELHGAATEAGGAATGTTVPRPVGTAAYAALAVELGYLLQGIYAVHGLDDCEDLRMRIINFIASVERNPNIPSDVKLKMIQSANQQLQNVDDECEKIRQALANNILVILGHWLGL
jgi:hypothetical protein